MMKDAHQKELIFKHFSSQGCFCVPEVPVYHVGGVREERKPLTDVDLLAIRPSPELRWALILGDCKTLRGQSAANRALWLRGLMDRMGADSGVLILRRQKGKPIEQDHKLFAADLGIHLLDEDEFITYDQALLYPAGSADHAETPKRVEKMRAVVQRFPKLSPFLDYIHWRAWNEPDHFEMLRKILGEARSIAREIDPARTDHLALVLEGAAVFAVPLATCVGLIFNQYLHPQSKKELDEALKVLIWGGRQQYHFLSRLRSELIEAKGHKGESDKYPLALPDWEEFLQVVRDLLEAPRSAFSLPAVLRTAALDVGDEVLFLSTRQEDALISIRHAERVASYFCRAAGFPREVQAVLSDRFMQRQSDILHSEPDRGTAAEAKVGSKEPGKATEQTALPGLESE